MTQLYTSIAHTKIAMQNGGAPPPVMQIARKWRDRFDLQYLHGLGALVEDERGLKCPFKGCEKWCRSLGPHVRSAHGVSTAELKEALGLPPSLSLLSAGAREKMSVTQQRIVREGKSGIVKAIAKRRRHRATEDRRKYRPKTRGMSVVARNWRGSCRAQLGEKLKAAVEESGVINMTRSQAIEILGHALLRRIERTFGTWNLAKQSVGLPSRFRVARRLTLDLVVEGVSRFYLLYKRWPTAGDAQNGHSTPVMPSYNPILRVTETESWGAAMRVIRREIEKRDEARKAA